MPNPLVPEALTKAAVAAIDCDISIIVGSKPANDPSFVRSLSVVADLQTEFRNVARRQLVDLTNIELKFVEYDPGDSTADHEIMTLDLEDAPTVAKIIDQLKTPTSLSAFSPAAEDASEVSFYGSVMTSGSGDKKQQAVLLRRFTQGGWLKRSPKIQAVFSGNTFSSLHDEVMLFDKNTDCVVIDKKIYILRQTNFEQAFDHQQTLSANAVVFATELVEKIRISNPQDLIADSGQYMVAKKLASIKRRGSMDNIDMDEALAIAAEWGMNIQTTGEGDKKAFVYDRNPSERWKLLQLLDEDPVRSPLTENKFMSSAKRLVQ